MRSKSGILISDLIKAPILALFSKNGYDNTFDPSGTSVAMLREKMLSRETKFVRDENGKLYKVSGPKGFDVSGVKFVA